MMSLFGERNVILIFIAFAFLLTISSSLVSNSNNFGTTKVAYSQSDPDQMSSNTTIAFNIQDIPVEKVRVGDIEIAYKTW
jgi:hypothetical protein